MRSIHQKASPMAKRFLRVGSIMISVVSVVEVCDAVRQNPAEKHGWLADFSIDGVLVVM